MVVVVSESKLQPVHELGDVNLTIAILVTLSKLVDDDDVGRKRVRLHSKDEAIPLVLKLMDVDGPHLEAGRRCVRRRIVRQSG